MDEGLTRCKGQKRTTVSPSYSARNSLRTWTTRSTKEYDASGASKLVDIEIQEWGDNPATRRKKSTVGIDAYTEGDLRDDNG